MACGNRARGGMKGNLDAPSASPTVENGNNSVEVLVSHSSGAHTCITGGIPLLHVFFPFPKTLNTSLPA